MPTALRFVAIAVLMPKTVVVLADHIKSPDVQPDGTVTFRLKSKAATEILVDLKGKKTSMSKGESDIWSATISDLKPGIHEYVFEVDGTRVTDPANRNIKKWFSLASMVEIPAKIPLLTEFRDVPHGVVQRLIYYSNATKSQRPVVVYTPPGYNHKSNVELPLIVLMHGFGDDETAWTEVGRAHHIADNLIAEKRIQKCVIAMPFGHPIPAPFANRPDDYFPDNSELYDADIIQNLLPFLEENFHLQKSAEGRSIVGLSMGGGHAVHTGLRHVDTFSSIGAFSAAVPELNAKEMVAQYPSLTGESPTANNLKHFWIPIGVDDFLLDRNDEFVDILKKQNVQHSYTQTDGGHQWSVWRKYLPMFLEKVVAK